MSTMLRRHPFHWRAIAPLIFLPMVTARLDAQEDMRPFARVSLEPGPSVTVGQPLTIFIEVLVPSFFSGAPIYPDVELRDALVLFVYRGNNFTERINRVTWAGQRRSYEVYPQRPGTFEILQIPVGVRYRPPGGRAGETTTATASPPPVRFEATLPPGAEGLNYFISAQRLQLQDTFDERPDTLLVGEAFTRTITATVEGALSMVIPPLTFDTVAGVASYPKAAETEDIEGFGVQATVGRRVEAVTYVAQSEGDYTIPGLELQWWDVNAARLRTATVPPVEFHVRPNPSLVAEIPLPEDTAMVDSLATQDASTTVGVVVRRWGLPVAATFALLMVALRLIRRYGPRVRVRWRLEAARRRESEAAYFRRFEQAARSNDPEATARALMSWLDRREAGGVPTFARLAAEADDPVLTQELRRLEGRLYGAGRGPDAAKWSAAELSRRVARARRRARKHGPPARPGALSGLNHRTVELRPRSEAVT